MNPQILSLMGIFLALILVVAGSLRGISIIILSSVAAFLVAATGGIGLLDGYGAYLEGVAGSVTSMFPLFLGGQLLGCFLEKSGLTEAIANAVIHRSGTRGIVVAVFTVSWLLTFCGTATRGTTTLAGKRSLNRPGTRPSCCCRGKGT